MRRLSAFAAAILALSCAAATAQTAPRSCGAQWPRDSRARFYSLDQGSRMIPMAWAQALKQADGSPFLAADLTRYGFLVNEFAAGLPVGFSTGTVHGEPWLGMTCAACHTRAIKVANATCIIDGGPAFADFEAFARDLDAAMAAVLPDQPGFRPFAALVLGGGVNDATLSALGARVTRWQRDFHLWISAMPSGTDQPWGPARMDAVGMIFNRLVALDLGLPPAQAAANLLPAHAAVRYPFLWNAPTQDYTQWTRFAPNSTSIYGLFRNLGEVYGVFGLFAPTKTEWGTVDYLAGNSAEFAGLGELEDLTRTLAAPRFRDTWPPGQAGAIDDALAERGQTLFTTAGCAQCHGKVVQIGLEFATWRTGPVPLTADPGTDRLAAVGLDRKGDSGILAGERVAVLSPPLGQRDTAKNILTLAIVNSYLQHLLQPNHNLHAAQRHPAFRAADDYAQAVASATVIYEARVLDGVWAAAPYLHNGSVPTLADLLEPSGRRPPAFAIGPRYDPQKVGLATAQDPQAFVLQTTGCDNLLSGKSRCGHEYGTDLVPDDKRALLEYLKTL